MHRYSSFFVSLSLPIKPSSQVPHQPNSYDCGIYLLHFVQTFMSDAKKYANVILVCSAFSVCLSDTLQSRPPEFKTHEAHKALWLATQNFALNKRKDLRLKIEALSVEWKKTPDAHNQRRNADESDMEVDCVDLPHPIGHAASMDLKQLNDDNESDLEIEWVDCTNVIA
jgi:hypothetical protein